MELNGATVLVTGATGGIGHAIARHLHREGAKLVLTGRRTDVLEPLAQELGATAIAVDLADAEQVGALGRECAHVDAVVHNAALPSSGHLLSFSEDEIDRSLDVNLRAPMILSRVLAPKMVERGRGHLVFVSSLSGKAATPGSSVYSATKFGLRGFGQGLRGDLRSAGVGVSVVFPGFIRDAGMFADSGVELPKGVGSNTPDDVAAGVVTAITKNRGELDVAPRTLRAGAIFSGIAPELAATVSRRLGSEKISTELAAGQADKR